MFAGGTVLILAVRQSVKPTLNSQTQTESSDSPSKMSKNPASISIEVGDDMELTKELTKDNKPLSNHSKVNKRAYLKYGSMIMLVFQNSALSITMRMARTQKELFISSTAVIMGELLKLITCLAMIRIDEGMHSLKVSNFHGFSL